jgi:hypothetical protein
MLHGPQRAMDESQVKLLLRIRKTPRLRVLFAGKRWGLCLWRDEGASGKVKPA